MHSGDSIRVEHWVVAERQGQSVAANMLGQNERFDAMPFFWSQHYDVPINYVGHAEQWDEIAIDGDIKSKDYLLRYKRNGRVLAVASDIPRCRESPGRVGNGAGWSEIAPRTDLGINSYKRRVNPAYLREKPGRSV